MPKSAVEKILSHEDLFSNPTANTYTAVIRYAFPGLNLYVVEPIINGSMVKTLVLASGDTPDSMHGGIATAYAVNDSVIVVSDKCNHGSMSVTDYITGYATVCNNVSDKTPANLCTLVYNKTASVFEYVYSGLKTLCGYLPVNAPKAFTGPKDILCGDTVISGSPNNNISVLKHIIRIQCGKKCFVELDSILSRIRVVTDRCEYIGPLQHAQDLTGDGSLTRYTQEAISPAELAGDTPMFRKKNTAGDISTGWTESVSIPDHDTSGSSEVYLTKVRYDGEATMVSAKGFEIRKSFDIATPYQTKETSGISGSVLADVSEFVDTANNYGPEDGLALMDRSINRGEEAITRRASEFPKADCNDSWGVTSDSRSENINEVVMGEHNPHIAPIGNKQYYDLPDTIELKDPHTGKTYIYFKSSSGIRYDSDGSLVFYDGYGSEIRMTRGNIIISPASDLILRPGRDLHGMIGRHTAIVSNRDVTVHSSTSDVYIKGNHNVSVLSGVDGSGGMLIDDRGDTGILMRSLSMAAFTAKDLYVGSIPDKMPKAFSIATQGAGNVVIGGGSSTLLTGDSITLYGTSADIISKDKDDVSWVSVQPDRIISISKDTSVSGNVYVGQVSGALTATIGNTDISVGNRASSSVLNVLAEVNIAYTLKCKDIWAHQARIRRLGAGNASRDSGISSSVSSPSITVTPPVTTQYSVPFVRYDGPWNDAFTLGKQFEYPDSSDIGINMPYIIPGMTWQVFMTSKSVWYEPGIPDLKDSGKYSMVYPGKAIWESGKITNVGHTTDNIIGGYVINGE